MHLEEEEQKIVLAEMACHELVQTVEYIIEQNKLQPETISHWKEALLKATSELVEEIGGMQ
tara:strand:- start:2010 stop:2192 length:183 start_codon:yes stop_codon:yes gene_type:complete